jgi:hypothetical protein
VCFHFTNSSVASMVGKAMRKHELSLFVCLEVCAFTFTLLFSISLLSRLCYVTE